MPNQLENVNPVVYEKRQRRNYCPDDEDDSIEDEIDNREIFDLIRCITDPEHPLTLEELKVVQLDDIKIDNKTNQVIVDFTPTVPHCSMATLIGLSLRVHLLRSLPPRYKVSVKIAPGTHSAEAAVNKQLADKERVAAALENSYLTEVINQCIAKHLFCA